MANHTTRLRASEMQTPLDIAVRRATEAALAVIEAEAPAGDAEFQLAAGREVAKLLASGILVKLQG